MQIKIRLGGIVFEFQTETDVSVSENLSRFIVFDAECVDVIVQVSWKWEEVVIPESVYLGEDLICRYYADQNMRYCLAKGGWKGYVACTVYTDEMRFIKCRFNEKPFINTFRSLDMIFRMLPMREILQYFNILFFHASQIVYKGRGILFTAPSGTGKSTQAKLWNTYRNAEVLCGDRTLTRNINGIWKNYGYPIDGSQPVYSSRVVDMGCVVLLEQGKENVIRQLRPAEAVSALMEQLVLDTWNPDARIHAMELLLLLVNDIPVFRFACTPDESAVIALEEELKRKEVF